MFHILNSGFLCETWAISGVHVYWNLLKPVEAWPDATVTHMLIHGLWDNFYISLQIWYNIERILHGPANERSEWVKYCFHHEKIKFICSSHRVIFFLLYRFNAKSGQWYLQLKCLTCSYTYAKLEQTITV